MIISVLNQKGGTAKTTSTANLGAALVKLKKRVLLIDLDPQGSLSFSLGIDEPENSIAEVLENEISFSKAICRINGEKMDLIPATIGLADTEINLVSNKERNQLLKRRLSSVTQYDYILIDCPPSLSLLSVNALTASDTVIIPFQLEVLSIRGLDQIILSIEKIKKAYNPKLAIAGLLPVMADKRKKLTQEVYEYVQQNFDVPLFKNSIRTNVRLSEAPSFAKSVFTYAPQSNGAKDYLATAKEFINKTTI